jgi:hypothetical protein
VARCSLTYSSSRCYGISIVRTKHLLAKTVPWPDMKHSNVLGSDKGALEDAISAMQASVYGGADKESFGAGVRLLVLNCVVAFIADTRTHHRGHR